MVDGSVTVERAEDWETLQRLLYRESPTDAGGRRRTPEVFRGHSNERYTLTTSLQRFVGETDEWHRETRLLRNFNRYAQQYIDEPESFHHLLALAQHHGLPTRLLDWTYSPLVATYFATGGDPDVDGELLVVDYVAAHEHLPDNLQTVRERADVDMLDVDLVEAGLEILLREADVDTTEARVRTGSPTLLVIRAVVSDSSIDTPSRTRCSSSRRRSTSASPTRPRCSLAGTRPTPGSRWTSGSRRTRSSSDGWSSPRSESRSSGSDSTDRTSITERSSPGSTGWRRG
jgi:hypothetical protein